VRLEESVVDIMLIEIEQQYDHVCILHCKGRLIAGPEMEYVQNKMEEIKTLACAKVLADFEDVTAIGSIGVTFIVGAYTSVMRQPGGRFVMTGVKPNVRHVLDLTRLSTVIPLASDIASGLAILRAEGPKAPVVLSNSASANLVEAERSKVLSTYAKRN
jgi:anti-anti-sigma factor